jgi:ATP-dependent exoDNAse (exonuclease V) beta subunit
LIALSYFLPLRPFLIGRIDLLLVTDKGIVVQDHKSTPYGPFQWAEMAQAYAVQLFIYAAGVERATQQRVTETWQVLSVAAAALSIARGRHKRCGCC